MREVGLARLFLYLASDADSQAVCGGCGPALARLGEGRELLGILPGLLLLTGLKPPPPVSQVPPWCGWG